ncbi:MAG: murein DD-endopeptidase MepM/ murein hydrolase activator NlpD [Myxococcota bacterium]|jgi:murein DD-endopeptidase MepM/ murein hydrolase activator NlpD
MLLLWLLVACGTKSDPPTDDTAPAADVPATGAGSTPSPGTDPSPSLGSLHWPIDCIPGDGCGEPLGYADPDGDGVAWDCGPPGYTGHMGVDIGFDSAALDAGVDVLAAADGVVALVFDGRHDRCHEDTDHPDCADPGAWSEPGETNGFRQCTELAPEYCGLGTRPAYSCFWCFDGGNLVVIQHPDDPVVFATMYSHLAADSIPVAVGDTVTTGQVLGQAAASGRATGPHLHFEVLGPTGWYDVTDPWAGPCSAPGDEDWLWANDPPWGG